MVSKSDIPQLGLGTYRNTDYDECVQSVRMALQIGYRHIDTAEAYGNEEAVGQGINEVDIDRDEVFLATKVQHPKFTDTYSSEAIKDNVRKCLERLDVESLDLLYGVHWPGGKYDAEETFIACADLYDDGFMENIGACNLTPQLLDDARKYANPSLMAIQNEMHPLLQQEELRAYCDTHDITFVAYAPLGYGEVFGEPVLEQIAEKHDTSVAQVSLAWLREKGVAAIPKSTSEAHLRDNWLSQQLELDAVDIEEIDNIPRENRVYDPDYAPDW